MDCGNTFSLLEVREPARLDAAIMFMPGSEQYWATWVGKHALIYDSNNVIKGRIDGICHYSTVDEYIEKTESWADQIELRKSDALVKEAGGVNIILLG